jgi:hypothetical protein
MSTDELDYSPIPREIDLLMNNFLNSHRFIRPKLKKGKLFCDNCGTEFFSNLPFYIKVDTATKELVCYPCNFKKYGSPYDQLREQRKKFEQKQKAKQMEQTLAYRIAEKLVEKLKPHCDKIEIAGSIRRKKTDVGDIEIVALPKMLEEPDGMFGDVKKHRSPDFVKTVNSFGKIIKGKPDKNKMVQVELPENIVLDLFLPSDFDFFRIYAIRTGSADFAQNTIAKGWVALGWCGTDDGLRLQKECEKRGEKWFCIVDEPTLPPVWQNEQEFFKWIGKAYVEPENRN